jgi:hypothetical protein
LSVNPCALRINFSRSLSSRRTAFSPVSEPAIEQRRKEQQRLPRRLQLVSQFLGLANDQRIGQKRMKVARHHQRVVGQRRHRLEKQVRALLRRAGTNAGAAEAARVRPGDELLALLRGELLQLVEHPLLFIRQQVYERVSGTNVGGEICAH